MLAHNEDDWGKRVVNWYNINEKLWNKTDSIMLKRGGIISQVSHTNSYLWLEIPELEFSDSYFSTKGLIITSNACASREDDAEINNGGIGYWLRRIMIERANTAREAVQLAGQIISEIGYASSGRTYSIADANEVWMLSVVKGKHWVARRIPDNHIAIIPNYYTIKNVDISDTINFLSSPDLISYAIKRKWYLPERDGDFNFRKAYSSEDNLKSIGNIGRHWVSLNMLSEQQYLINQEFPFSFIPKNKLELYDLFEVLRNHYEDTKLDSSKSYQNPHKQKIMSVCSNTNQYGFVAQLRNYLPTEIGAILWIAPRRPCTQSFIPIYSCIQNISSSFRSVEGDNAVDNHFKEIVDFDKYAKGNAHMVFNNYVQHADSNYYDVIPGIRKLMFLEEESLFKNQLILETEMSIMYLSNPQKVRSILSTYSNGLMKNAIEK